MPVTKVSRRPARKPASLSKGLKTASMSAIEAAVANLDLPERLVVEGATVVCTQMYEDESESKMKKTEGAIGIMRQGAYELTHKDIEFEPEFEKCKYDNDDCEPEIDEEQWFDYDETNMINGEYGILEEKSFMMCKKGFGLLYITECGQRPCDMKALLAKLKVKYGDRELLGDWMYAAFSIDPVNLATGNFIYAKTDLEIGGWIPIKFQRFYNTFDDQVGALGKGWRHPYDISLKETKEGVTITFEDGHDEVYKLGDEDVLGDKSKKPKKEEQSKEKSKGYRLSKTGERLSNVDDESFVSPDGNFSNLMRIRDSYRLVKSDETTLHFDKDGNLVKIVDQDQVETILTYEGDKLVGVVGLSSSLTFAYADDKIVTVTDHTGRTVSYTYEDDLLASATDPLGNVRTYTYDEKGRFLNEINPEGNLIVENEYDDKDRTIKQRFADGSEMSYDYEDRDVQNIREKLKTEFTAQNGAKTIYYRDIQYRTVSIEYPDYGMIQTEYNWKHQKISETDKIGPRTYYDYDDKGNLSRINNPLGDVTDLAYDEKNRITSIMTNGVVRLQNEYDKFGNLVVIEDGLKRQVRFSYDKETKGLPTHIVQPDGSVIKVKFNNRRNVTEAIDTHGVSTHYEYDSLNRIIKTTDGNGNSIQFGYDKNNNITRITNAEGNSQTYTYNKANKITNLTDFNGSNIAFAYNNLNKPETITDSLGRITQLSYDKMWNVSQVIQPNGAEIGFAYDENNRLVSIEKPDGSIIKYKYDKNDNQTQIIDEAGNATFLAYDKLQRLIEVRDDEGVQLSYTYNSDGQITSMTNAMDNTIQFMYNEVGELIKEINVLGDSRTYTYTTLGKVETVTDEVGRVTTYDYESGGRLKSVLHPDGTSEILTYDNNDNIKTHTNSLGLITTYVYDRLNRIVEVINADGGSKKYAYDPVGNVTCMVNELGHITNYSYTLSGQLEKVIDPLGNETHYVYDELDQLIEVKQLGEVDGTDGVELTSINPIGEANRITTYKRNLLGQVTSVTDALGQIERYKYDPTGQLTQKIDKDGFITEYGYTNQGDMSHIKYADGKEVHMIYNPLGQLTEVNDWFGTTTIELDPLGRALGVTNHRNERVEYTYGKAGERRSLTYPDGKIVNYHYDELLRLTQIQDGEQFTNYSYDQHSRMVEKQYPNNTSTKYEFNELGQLQSLIHSKLGKSYSGRNFEDKLDQFHYEYDKIGNKIGVNRIRKGFESKDHGRYHYQYDDLNRLTKVMRERDILRSYQYDAFGNRTRKVEKGKEISYTYNSLNQLISMHDEILHKYHYDGRGNLEITKRNDEITHEYSFGANNRLEEVQNHEKDLHVFYDYNGLGHRVGKKILDDKLNPLKQIDDVIDLSRPYHNLLQRTESDNVMIHPANSKDTVLIFDTLNEDRGDDQATSVKSTFVYDFNVLNMQTEDEKLHYLHDDLGSPIRLINDRGRENSFSYDEFGSSTHNKGAVRFDQPFTYTGYQLDEVSNSHIFAQAREYDPKIGRFISQDQITGFTGLPQSFNQYAYCWNQPLDFVDLDGLFLRRIGDGLRNIGTAIVDVGRDVVNTAVDAGRAVGNFIYEHREVIATGLVVVGSAALIVATGGLGVAPLAAAAAAKATKVTFGGFALAAGAGYGFGAGIELGAQLLSAKGTRRERWQQVDWDRVNIAGGTTALSTGMTAVGVPAPLAFGYGAGLRELAFQIHEDGYENIDLNPVFRTAALSAVLTSVGTNIFERLLPGAHARFISGGSGSFLAGKLVQHGNKIPGLFRGLGGYLINLISDFFQDSTTEYEECEEC